MVEGSSIPAAPLPFSQAGPCEGERGGELPTQPPTTATEGGAVLDGL